MFHLSHNDFLDFPIWTHVDNPPEQMQHLELLGGVGHGLHNADSRVVRDADYSSYAGTTKLRLN
jgi:hypothetical protein